MSTNRAAKIDAIIASRKPIASETAKKIEQLKSVQSGLQNCSDILAKFLQRGCSDEQKTAISERQNEIKIVLDDLLPASIRDLAQLERRFSRPTLNIGVVGNAGQGKSTLLQRLTGLSDDEIPTGAKGDCTGATAIIENAQVAEAYADIEFYSEPEFLAHVVAPYFRTMNLPAPSSLSEFSRPLPGDVQNKHYDETKFIERLQAGLEDCRRFFGESAKRIGRAEIRNYTAKSDKDGRPLSLWAAVKSAKVYCPFSGLGSEKISVGDTPGLGDRAVLEAEAKLMNDFGRNIDAVVMLRKVKERGIRMEDVRLFGLVKAAIPELPPEKWSYFMVNVFASDRAVSATADALKFLPEDFKDSSLKDMQGYAELDCSDRDAVQAEFDKMLDGIAANQQALDKAMYAHRIGKARECFAKIVEQLPKLAALFPPVSIGGEQESLAKAMFREGIWGELGIKLDELVNKYKRDKESNNAEFIKNLESIESDFKQTPGLPSVQEMKKLSSTYKLDTALSFGCQKVRRLILSEFDRMDKGFKEQFDKLREEAKQCFEDEDGGKMGSIVFDQEAGSWWAALASEVALLGVTPKSKSVAEKISVALRKFNESSLSFRSFLLPRILPCLDVLDTDSSAHDPYKRRGDASIEDLIELIDTAARNGIQKACDEIRKSAEEPSRALFACIEEMHDAVLRTESAEFAGALWSDFYSNHPHEVWPEIFKKKEADAKFRSEWNEAVASVKTTTERADG